MENKNTIAGLLFILGLAVIIVAISNYIQYNFLELIVSIFLIPIALGILMFSLFDRITLGKTYASITAVVSMLVLLKTLFLKDLTQLIYLAVLALDFIAILILSLETEKRRKVKKLDEQKIKEEIERAVKEIKKELHKAPKYYVASKVSKDKKYHTPDCISAKRIRRKNKIKFSSQEEAEKAGYEPCDVCLKYDIGVLENGI